MTDITATDAAADTTAPPYAPFGLGDEAASFGLVPLTVDTELGSVRVHRSSTRSGSTATLLLHGAAGSWTTWTPLIKAAREAGEPLVDVVAIDLPGWGASPGPRIRSQLTLDALAEVVWQIVHTRLAYERVDIIGHSLGAFIALHLAATRPAQVEAVRLVSATTFSVLASVEHPVRSFTAVPGFTLLLAVFRVLRMGGDRGAGLVRAVRRAGLLRLAVSPLFRHPLHVPRSVVDALADEVRPDSFVRASEATRGYPLALWAGIRCPVWAIRGDSDSFVPSGDLTGLLRALPLATLAEIRDCGHFAHVERPHESLNALGLTSLRR
jgi:pimeloyl-ACP methyl ester carboxylesterase